MNAGQEQQTASLPTRSTFRQHGEPAWTSRRRFAVVPQPRLPGNVDNARERIITHRTFTDGIINDCGPVIVAPCRLSPDQRPSSSGPRPGVRPAGTSRASAMAVVGPPIDARAMTEATTGLPNTPTTAAQTSPSAAILAVSSCARFWKVSHRSTACCCSACWWMSCASVQARISRWHRDVPRRRLQVSQGKGTVRLHP